MFRIKTTCKNKAVFLSPFVFTEEQAKEKLKSLPRLHQWDKRPKFEIVPVERYPNLAVWKERHPSMGMLRQLEDMWTKLSNAEYAKAQSEG